MKFFTVFVDKSGMTEIKLGTIHDGIDRDAILRRPSDFAEFDIPAGKDEGLFLRQKFKEGVSPKTSVVVVLKPGARARAWRIRV
jgi:hypothetical protein